MVTLPTSSRDGQSLLTDGSMVYELGRAAGGRKARCRPVGLERAQYLGILRVGCTNSTGTLHPCRGRLRVGRSAPSTGPKVVTGVIGACVTDQTPRSSMSQRPRVPSVRMPAKGLGQAARRQPVQPSRLLLPGRRPLCRLLRPSASGGIGPGRGTRSAPAMPLPSRGRQRRR